MVGFELLLHFIVCLIRYCLGAYVVDMLILSFETGNLFDCFLLLVDLVGKVFQALLVHLFPGF